jgi:hypothetical protein
MKLQAILYRCWLNSLYPSGARSIEPLLPRPESPDTVTNVYERSPWVFRFSAPARNMNSRRDHASRKA